MKTVQQKKADPGNCSAPGRRQENDLPVREQWLSLKGCRIHFLECGNSQPSVVLLHGGGPDCASFSWKTLLPILGKTYHVLAPDLPGFGLSDAYGTNASLDTYCQFIREFLSETQVSKPSLVGLSMGGMLALDYTLQQPKQVEKLVLVDSAGLGPNVPFPLAVWLLVRWPWLHDRLRRAIAKNRLLFRLMLQRVMFDLNRLEPEVAQEIRNEYLRPDRGGAWREFLEEEIGWRGFRNNYHRRLAEIRVPTLLVHGENDRLIPLRLSREAQRRIEGSRLEVFAGCGHWPPREKPEEFNRLVADFLNSG